MSPTVTSMTDTYADGYQAALRDLGLAVATGGARAVNEWVANNAQDERTRAQAKAFLDEAILTDGSHTTVSLTVAVVVNLDDYALTYGLDPADRVAVGRDARRHVTNSVGALVRCWDTGEYVTRVTHHR